MNIPQTTTKISGANIFIIVVAILSVPMYLLWSVSAREGSSSCMDAIVLSWMGEYPEPVIVIKETIEWNGRRDFCTESTEKCTLSPQVIHPWAETKDIQFATLPPNVLFRLNRSMSSNLQDYPIGQEVFWEGQLSAGMCSFRVGSDRWMASCEEEKNMTQISGNLREEPRPFFSVTCTEGYKVWVEVTDSLFDTVRVDKGVIKGYGVVSIQ